MHYSALLTDLYELTMLAGYFEEGMHEKPATFDLFFRTAPFEGNFAVFAGLEPALDYLSELHFSGADLAYLEGLGIFKPPFLEFLGHFRFRGRVTAPPEGTVVFANEPLLSIEGTLAEAQFVETALLNIVNFQTLAATKASRISQAAGSGVVLEFGLRRAQGPDGGLSEARAAYIGGVRSTSNVWAGQVYGIPVKGTHAHSWVMAFPDELTAFRAYAECFPENCVLLVDTYDTLKSGIPNALIVAGELRERGYQMFGVRLDSGDLAYLSKEARRMFDAAGFPEVKIVASNELDEHLIESIRNEGGQVDIYGVGTKLATCAGAGGGALGGVYKLVRFDGTPRLKVTSDIAKATLPDRKRLLRGPKGRDRLPPRPPRRPRPRRSTHSTRSSPLSRTNGTKRQPLSMPRLQRSSGTWRASTPTRGSRWTYPNRFQPLHRKALRLPLTWRRASARSTPLRYGQPAITARGWSSAGRIPATSGTTKPLKITIAAGTAASPTTITTGTTPFTAVVLQIARRIPKCLAMIIMTVMERIPWVPW